MDGLNISGFKRLNRRGALTIYVLDAHLDPFSCHEFSLMEKFLHLKKNLEQQKWLAGLQQELTGWVRPWADTPSSLFI